MVQRLEAAALGGLQAAVGALPWERRPAVGARLGDVWYAVDARHRRIARDNLAAAFPDWSAAQVRRVVRAAFRNLGATAAEFIGLGAATPEDLAAHCRFEGEEHLQAARAGGRGCYLLTAHLGNWEVAGAALAARGVPFYAVARRQKNHAVDRRINGLRERFGGTVIPHRHAVRPVMRALRSGGVVAFLLDQKASGREGVPSRFFGRPVSTNRGLAVLALKTGHPVVPAFSRREGVDHVSRYEPALVPPEEGDAEERVRRFTEAIDAAIETAVRRVPEQWFWVHRRWRLPGGFAP